MGYTPPPLEPDVHKTGKWTFSGKNLPDDEVQALTEKGVDWKLDIMPDGRLKHPRFRRFRIANRAKALKKAAEYTMKETDELKARYDALPEPKPSYFQWAAREEEAIHYANVKRIAMHSKQDHVRIKALAVLLENGLVKPKTVVEATSTTPDEQIDLDKALNILLEAKLASKGIKIETFEKWIDAEAVEVKPEA